MRGRFSCGAPAALSQLYWSWALRPLGSCLRERRSPISSSAVVVSRFTCRIEISRASNRVARHAGQSCNRTPDPVQLVRPPILQERPAWRRRRKARLPSDAPAANASARGSPRPYHPATSRAAWGFLRVVEIDTTGGPGFGFETFKQYDFLRDKEVVLTFDDGPWPSSTPAVLKALADECLKATFFEIGEHATWHPEITKEVINAGMTVGTHTWSHKDLARNPYAKDIKLAEQEIEMGISAVHMAAASGKVAPFASPTCSIRRSCCRTLASTISVFLD